MVLSTLYMVKKVQSGLSYLISEIFTKPSESPNASKILVKSVWFLRITTFVFGTYQIIAGEKLIGILIVFCVIFLVAPFFITRGHIANIPLEIEFFIFIMVVFQFIIGETQGFYTNIAHYDTVIHFFFPFLISAIGFTIAYTLYFSGKLKVSIATMIFIVILTTMGIGAIWEIIEYGNDIFLVPRIKHWDRFQGTSAANANYDTMNDLTADLLGGIIGSLIASKYVIEEKYNKRMRELFSEIIRDFFNSKKTKKH